MGHQLPPYPTWGPRPPISSPPMPGSAGSNVEAGVQDVDLSAARTLFSPCAFLSATLGKAFPECFWTFIECPRHSGKQGILVVVGGEDRQCAMQHEVGDPKTQFFTGSPIVKLQMNGLAASPAPAPSDLRWWFYREQRRRLRWWFYRERIEAKSDCNNLRLSSIHHLKSLGKRISVGKLLGIILPVVLVAAVVFITVCIWNVRKKRIYQRAKLPHRTHTAEDLESIKSILLSLSSLQVATDNFNENNKLGQGGFGAVYKGDLSGQEEAVKRLSNDSSQGLEELQNELVLVAKHHHKNLVRLEGF
ncbi:hypothetical protein EJB05_13566, partial [Eragrostis curvula]